MILTAVHLDPARARYAPLARPAALRPDIRANRLLAALPDAVCDRIEAQSDLVELRAGTVLQEAGVAVSHVHFPIDAIASLLYESADGASVEIARIGYEGMVGVSALMDPGSTLTRAVLHGAGRLLRMPVAALRAEFQHGAALQALLLRYTQSLITQMTQTAVCNRHHSVEQQLCRLLLQSLDRLHGNEIALTHEVMASLLGVRREGVTEAAGRLQRRGHISYRRGRISVLDRGGLERYSCECYAVVKRENERLLPVAAAA